jgi:hypothetical protein
MSVSPELLKKASIFERVLWNITKDDKICERLEHKYQNMQEIKNESVNDYLEYIKSNCIPLCKLKLLICLVVMDRGNINNQLPPIRLIGEHCNLKLSDSRIHYYFVELVKSGWITKVNHKARKKQYYKACIGRSKAIALYNFICSYEHAKAQDKSINFKIKQLKKLVEKYQNYELMLEDEIKKDLKIINKSSTIL